MQSQIKTDHVEFAPWQINTNNKRQNVEDKKQTKKLRLKLQKLHLHQRTKVYRLKPVDSDKLNRVYSSLCEIQVMSESWEFNW